MIKVFFSFFLEVITVLILWFLDNPFIGLGFFYLMLALNTLWSSYFDTLSNMMAYVDFKDLKFKQRKEYILCRIKYRMLNPINLIFLMIVTYIIHIKFGFMYLWALFPVKLFLGLVIISLIIVSLTEILVNIFLYKK